MTRRSMLGATAAALGLGGLAAACSVGGEVPPATPGTPAPAPIRYGADPSQYAVLHLPAAANPPAPGPLPVVVVIHGGYWQAQYGLDLGTPLAVDLTNAGVAALNVEYRRIGSGGGFPTTFVDVATAIDLIPGEAAAVAARAGRALDPARVAFVGHSAGGQLAVWAASRPRLPAGAPGAGPRVLPRGVVSQAGVLDLVAGSEQGLGGGSVDQLLGGSPQTVPDRYAVGSPAALVPAPCPVVCVHGDADTTVPLDQSQRYVAADTAAGGRARLRVIPGADHFALIDPAEPAWAACREEALAMLG